MSDGSSAFRPCFVPPTTQLTFTKSRAVSPARSRATPSVGRTWSVPMQ